MYWYHTETVEIERNCLQHSEKCGYSHSCMINFFSYLIMFLWAKRQIPYFLTVLRFSSFIEISKYISNLHQNEMHGVFMVHSSSSRQILLKSLKVCVLKILWLKLKISYVTDFQFFCCNHNYTKNNNKKRICVKIFTGGKNSKSVQPRRNL